MNDQAAPTGRKYIDVSPMVKKALPGFKISRAVRSGPWLFTNGQMDMGEGANALNPGDLAAQTLSCMRSVYEVMARADCRLSELAQLQIFYLVDALDDEAGYRERILEEFPECRDVLMVMTPVPSFATVGSVVEIDAIAVKGRRDMLADGGGVVRGVRRGDWVFANDRVVGGTASIAAGLGATLDRLGCDLGDVCRLYAYFPADLDPAIRATVEGELASAFAAAPPAYHATLLPAGRRDGLTVELEVIARSGSVGDKVRHGRATAPRPDLDWPFADALRCAGVVFTSGQFPVDGTGEGMDGGNIATQARIVMQRLERVLQQAGAGMDRLVKIKTYYEGAWDKENWFDNLRARMERLSDPGPASSGIEGLPPVIAGALLSTDGIAIVDDAPDA